MKPEAGSAWNVGMGKIMPYPRRKTGAILRQNRLSGEKPESAARNGIVRGSLNWAPRWSLETALDKTVEWHQAWKENQPMAELSIQQIEAYQKA